MGRLRIDADLLIPGRGAPIVDAAIVLDDEQIAYAGPADAAPPADRSTSARVVMPGMWEAHGHFYGTRGGLGEGPAPVASEVLAYRAAVGLRAALDAGFTSVREAGGGLGFALAELVEAGDVDGPAIYASGPFLSCTGGHGDHHDLPTQWVRDLCNRGGHHHLCDGVPACLEAVRLQLRRGARCIKVCTSGGVASLRDHPQHEQFSPEELRAIVEEAARHDVAVMAHAHGRRGILAAIEAGCATIEHGSFLDDQCIDLMLERGTILVPTRMVIERILASRQMVPPYMATQIDDLAARHLESMAAAHAAGVPIALGTDVAHLPGPGSLMPWGSNGQELRHLVDAGMTTLEAIEAATANGPSTLGAQAPASGRLAAGFDADVLALTEDPIDDIEVLCRPDAIERVWRGGRLVKDLSAGTAR